MIREEWRRLLEVSFAEPERVWIGAGLFLLWWIVPLWRGAHRRRGFLGTMLLRGAGFACLLAVLCEPFYAWTSTQPGRVVAYADVSPSMGEDGLAELRRMRDDAPPYVEWRVFAREVAPWTAPLRLAEEPGTDLAAPLRSAAADRADDVPVRIVVLSDGRATTGGADAAARALRRTGATLDGVALPDRKELAHAPARVTAARLVARTNRDDPFVVEAGIAADGAGKATVRLFVDGVEAESRDVALQSGEQRITFAPLQPTPGRHDVQVLLEGDGSPADNTAWTHFVVPGTPRIALIANEKRESLIAKALAAQGLEVVVGGPEMALDGFDVAVLLPDAPAGADYGALSGFVGEGGGLLAVGGTEGEGLARLYGKPVSFLLPLSVPKRPPPPAPPPPPDPQPKKVPRIEIEERETEAFPISLCLVIDRSGSMAGVKIARAKAAAVAAADALTPQDRIAVVAFGDKAELVVAPQPAGRGRRVGLALRRMEASGQTAMFSALEGAFQLMKREPSPIRHIVLLSDGLPSDEGRWRDLLTAITNEKITLSSVGIGWDFDKQFLLRLAQWGRGKYWSANHPTDIPQVVTQDTLRVVEARDGKRRDAERSRPPPEDEEKEPDPPTPPPTEKEKPPAPTPPPPAVRIVANPAVPREMLAGVADTDLPEVAGFEKGTLRFSAWSAARAGEEGPPLLSYWRVGLGRVAVWTADPEAPATRALASHAEFARLMAQLVRSVVPDAGREPIAVSPSWAWERDGEFLYWRVRGEDGAVRSDVTLTARIGDTELPVVRRGGRYRIDLGHRAEQATVVTSFGPRGKPWVTRHVVVPPSPPLEPLGLDADRTALRRLVGDPERLNPPRDRLWQRPLITRHHRRPMHLPFLALAAILLPLDAWARRRLASGSR